MDVGFRFRVLVQGLGMPNVILQSVENPACQRLLWDPLEPCGHQEEPSDETVELSELKERIGLGIRVWGLGFRGLGV